MSVPSRRIRMLALLQLVLLVPPTLGGSVCIPLDESGGAEVGLCACTVSFGGTAEAEIRMSGTADCGPCRDAAFIAMRSAPPPAPDAPVPTSPYALSYVAPVAPPIADAHVFWSGEPPGRHLPILRC